MIEILFELDKQLILNCLTITDTSTATSLKKNILV